MSVLEDATIVTPSASNAFSRDTLADRATQARSRLRDICQAVGLWLRRRHDRAMLRSLSPRDIHDFCPRHTEAEAEMSKPFWRA